MILESVTDITFKEYGRVIDGYDFSGTFKILRERIPRPLDSIIYVASEPMLEALSVFDELRTNFYGGMPIQAGYCSGYGTQLNALEYHRDTEINITIDKIILLLALRTEINYPDWTIQSSKVRAFSVPAGTAVELYATTLHYAPSSADETGFQVVIVLPRGTNGPKPSITAKNTEDRLLFSSNKWLLAHPDAKAEISKSAYIGIKGDNPDVRLLWK
jgi:hypothetical protein